VTSGQAVTSGQDVKPAQGGLLEGVRVIDLTNVLAGPFASYQLALMGADVVKIEVPDVGDLARQLGAAPELSARGMGASFLAQNADKRSITVDLKTEGGREVFAALVAGADVVVENFRPGVLERLGFGWDRLRQVQPRLVYCAISGFGQTGPMCDRPAYDQVIQGLSGMMSVTGTAGTAPLRAGFPLCDTFGGMTAAFAICAALHRAERTGTGAFLDISMLEAAITSLGWIASDYLIAGRIPVPMGNENSTSAPSGTFATGDGLLNIAANKQEQFEVLCGLVGRVDLLSDPRFADREGRKAHRNDLRAEVEAGLANRSAAAWERVLSAGGVPAARVLSVAEVVALDQVEARDLVSEVPLSGASGRSVRVLGSGIHVDGQSIGPSDGPPLLGEHTDEILREAGFTETRIRDLREDGAL
jgi:crotonobetainyl-CoA:carnitine CoA-transferase CaiB-like acyl-CoA transferase